MRYNGWTNYETWVINLHLTNDEGTCEYYLGMVSETSDVHSLAESIKNSIEEMASEVTNPLLADLLSAAIGEANFYEIAEAFFNEATESEDNV